MGRVLSKSHAYFQDLLSQGYSEQDAIMYTKKYYPEFVYNPTIDTPAPVVEAAVTGNQEFNPYAPSPTAENQPIISQEMKEKFSTGLEFISEKTKLMLSDKRLVTGIAFVVAAVILAAVILLIPATSGPVEGKWIKADGQMYEFQQDGDLIDGTSFTSTWDYEGTVLTMTSTRLAVNSNNAIYEMSIVQKFNIKLIDDENAMWMNWITLEIDGEQSSEMLEGCILMIKQDVASNSQEFHTAAIEYEDDKPGWC